MPDDQTPPDGFDLDAESQGSGGIVAREPIEETDHPDPVDVDGSAEDDNDLEDDDGHPIDEDI